MQRLRKEADEIGHANSKQRPLTWLEFYHILDHVWRSGDPADGRAELKYALMIAFVQKVETYQNMIKLGQLFQLNAY